MEKSAGAFDKISPEHFREFLKLPAMLNSSLELGKVLQAAMDLASKIVRAEASSLLLLEEHANQLYFKTATGKKSQEVKQFKLKLGEGIAGWVAQNGRPLLVADVNREPRYQKEISESIDFPTRSILCVPLKSRNKILGVVEVLNKIGDGGFTEEDQSLLELVADQAAIAIENAKLHGELNEETQYLRAAFHSQRQMVGSSPPFQKVINLVEKAAPTDSTLLLRGESGTGKELLAHIIHERSARGRRPFVCVTCSILSDTLLESELFGHEKGSFTGAISRKIGRFEAANRGTVFLDEIGTLNPNTQLRLLRVLQEKEFERVGGNETIKVDLRIIAATNENLEKAIREGRFREDLYYRLKVIEIQLPPLRERKEDIPSLVQYYLDKLSREIGRKMTHVSPEAMEVMKAYRWPGNIRELKNTLERAVVLGSGDTLRPEHLPPEMTSGEVAPSAAAATPAAPTPLTLEEAERQQILAVLGKTGGNKSQAAKILKISRNRLDRKIKLLNLGTQYLI